MKRALFWFMLAPMMCLIAACDDQSAVPTGPTSAPSTTAPAVEAAQPASPAPNAGGLAGQLRTRVQLIALPLTAEVPESWKIQQDVGNRIVLRGNTPSSEVDILLSQWPAINQQDLDLILKKIKDTSTSGPTAFTTYELGDLRVIQEIEVLGDPGKAARSTPMRWTVRYYRSGGTLEWAVYEMNVLGVTQESLELDREFLEQIIRSVRYDESANRTLTP